MNENVKSGDIIDGKNRRKAIFFAVTICALMLLSSFSVLASTLNVEEVVDLAQTTDEPITADSIDDPLAQLPVAALGPNQDTDSDDGPTSASPEGSLPLTMASSGNIASLEMPISLIPGSYSKGPTPTPIITYNIGATYDTSIGSPPYENYNWGGAPYMWLGDESWGGGGQMSNLVYFDLTGISPLATSDLIQSANYYAYCWAQLQPGLPGAVILPILGPWVEGTGYYTTNPGAGGVTWLERWPGATWTTPGGDYLFSPFAIMPYNGVDQWWQADVHDIASAWISGLPNCGIIVMNLAPIGENVFYTREAGVAPLLTLNFYDVSSYAETVTSMIDSDTNSLTVPFNADTLEANGIDYVNLYYRYSWDNASWSSWQYDQNYGCTAETSVDDSFTFATSMGNGYYQFYTETVTNDGTVEGDPVSADASALYWDTSSAGPLGAIYTTQEFSVPFNASTFQSNGLDHVDLYYRYSPDNGSTVSWTPWTFDQSFPCYGVTFIDDVFTFNASAGKGGYEFYTVATTVDGYVEPAPAAADAATFYWHAGPFPPTNIACVQLLQQVIVSWALSIGGGVDWYNIYKASDPSGFVFDPLAPYDSVSNISTTYLDAGAANDLVPDYYVVRAFNATYLEESDNVDYARNLDCYIITTQSYSNSNVATTLGKLTVANNRLTITNSNLTFSKITVNSPNGRLMVGTSSNLTVNGNLTVLGKCVLSDTDLFINSTWDGQYGIYVGPGAGDLRVENDSSIQGGSAGSNYLFHVDGALTLGNSTMVSCGMWNQSVLGQAGLFIDGIATIDSTTITDCVVGVIANATSTKVTVSNSFIADCRAAIYAYGTNSLIASDNLIVACGSPGGIIYGESPADQLHEGGIGAYASSTTGNGSNVGLKNNEIYGTYDYALYTDSTSRMDWKVDNFAACTNFGPLANILLNGNISVTNSGSQLILDTVVGVCDDVGVDAGSSMEAVGSAMTTKNVTVSGSLWVNSTDWSIDCAYDGQNHIQVLGGMYVQDDSAITSTGAPAFTFYVESSAEFLFDSSHLANCGYGVSDERELGLYIATDNATVSGSQITYGYVGIVTDDASPLIVGNSIAWNDYGIYCLRSNARPTIVANSIGLNAEAGIYVSYDAAPLILYNSVSSNGDTGITCQYGFTSTMNVTIEHNTVNSNSGDGIYIEPTTDLIGSISNNTVNSNVGSGIWIINGAPGSADLNMTGNIVNANLAMGIVFFLQTAVNLTFDDNDVIGNADNGLLVLAFNSINLTASGDDIWSNDGFGIALVSMSGSVSASVVSSQLLSNTMDGMALSAGGDATLYVTNSNIASNGGNGISVQNVGTSNITVTGNYFDDNQNGLYVNSGTIASPFIFNNYIGNSISNGIQLSADYGISDALIVVNDVLDSGQNGICLYMDVSGNITGLIGGNDVSGSGTNGISAESTSGDIDLDVTGNTADDCGNIGISIWTQSGNITADVLGNVAMDDSNISVCINASNGAKVDLQDNYLAGANNVSIYIISTGNLSATLVNNTVENSLYGIMVGDIGVFSASLPWNTTLTAVNNSITGCILGMLSISWNNLTALVDNNYVDGNMDGIVLAAINSVVIDSKNNTVTNNIGGPVGSSYYIMAMFGDTTLVSTNDTCSSNGESGMSVSALGNINATFDGCAFDYNGEDGLNIYSSVGYANVTISNTQAIENDGAGGIIVIADGNMATVGLSNVTANNNYGTGIFVSAATDLMLTGDGVAANGNYDGLIAVCLGVTTIALNNTFAGYNDDIGISSKGTTIFANIDNSSANYNNLYGIALSAADNISVDMAYVNAYYNSGTNILLEGVTVEGVMTDVVGYYSYNECGLKVSATGNVTLGISDSTFDYNYLNGVEIAGSNITLDANNVYAWYNSQNGLYVNALSSADLYVNVSDMRYNSDDGVHAEVASGPLTVEIDGTTLYSNSNNGLEAIASDYYLVDISVHSQSSTDSSITWNGDYGIRATSLYWVNLTVDDGTWIAWNGWSTNTNAGIYVDTDGASIDISGSSYIWSNFGNGIEAIGGSTTDAFGINIGIDLNSSIVNYNWEDGISIDTDGPASINAFNAEIYSNSQCGIDVDSNSGIFSSIDISSISWNGWDGINLSTPYSVWLGMTTSYSSYNSQNGVYVDANNVYVAGYDAGASSNSYDGLDVNASNYASIDLTGNVGSGFASNILNGIHVKASGMDIWTDGSVYASGNGECGLNLTAAYINMYLDDLAAVGNYDDGISAVASDDIYFNGAWGAFSSNGANGVDIDASDYLIFIAQWCGFGDNNEDGASLYGGNYVDANLANPNAFNNNLGDGLDIDTGDDCEVYAAPQTSFDDNGGCGANITAPDYVDLYIDGFPWSRTSFSNNGEHGLYVNSDSMGAFINSVDAEQNAGRGIWLSTTDNLSPNLFDIYAVDNGDDGALIQSINGSVYQTLFGCTFTSNDGNGLMMLALNGDIIATIDNCYLDSNGENGLYLLGVNVSLYPGLSVANSYSWNGGDGIHLEAFNYAYMEANLLESSNNVGNGITLSAPDGQIWLVQVSCDNNENGIYVDGAIQGEIEYGSTDYNSNAGISVHGGYNLYVHDSYASYNTVVGMEMYDCSNIDIENNLLEYNGVGIYIDNTADSTIVNNDIHYNFLDGIDVVNGSDVTLINNVITFNFGWGIFSEPGVNIEWIADSSYNGEYAYAKMNDILLWGNITVMDFSLMTLEDLNVTIGTNQNLQRNIEIYSDGLMNINDAMIQALGSYWYYFDVWGVLDTDFATIQGAWEVRAYMNSELNILRSSILDAGLYGIRAEAGSFVNVLDSYFSGCGFSGMYIESNMAMVSGTTFDNNYRGIWLVDVGPINIEDCFFTDNERDGILVDDSYVTIPFCSFNGNGRGVRVDNYGLGVVDQCWFGSNAVGVDILNGGEADVTLSTFDSNDVGFYLDTWSYAWVENCTMDSLVQEFSQRGSSLANTLNTVFSGPTYIIDSSALVVMWYLDVEVLDEAYDPIESATVDICDNYGTWWVSGGLTDADGMLRWIVLTNYIKDSGGVDDSMNPHTIYVSDGTASDSRDVTIDGTMTQTFVLNHAPVYNPGSMSDVFFDQGMWIDDVFNLNDCFTDKGNLDFTYSGNTMIYVWIDWNGLVSFESIDPDWSGSESITFRATDEDGLYTEHTIMVTVLRINTGPTIVSTPITGATQDLQYYCQVAATDPDIPFGDYLTYSLAIAPSGMSINSVTGLISWIPNWVQVGINWVQVAVYDSFGVYAYQLYAISVANLNDEPYITSVPSITSAEEGTPYSGTVAANDLDLNYGDILSFSLTTAPTGMIIDSTTGIIYWTPAYNQVGNNPVTVRVTDLFGASDSASFTMTVANVNQAPVITSTPITSATQDAQYYYQVTASDLDLPYGDVLTFSLSSSPAGMTINPTTGLIAWVPNSTQVGMNWITVTVNDTAVESDSQQFLMVVSNVNDAPMITSATVITAAAGVLYTYDVNATDPDLPFGDVLVYSLTTATAGMSIDASTGLIQWMPDIHSPTPVTIVVRVTDSGGLSATQSYLITVSGINHAPSITSVALSPSAANASTNISASAVGWADAESDAAQYLYQWYINGEAVGGANGQIISGLFTRGDIVACEITPYDGKEYGTPVESGGLVISNSAPSIQGASILPVSPIMKDQLTIYLSGVNDVDTQDVVVCLYQWQVFNTTTSVWDDIAGANSDTLGLNMLKVGDKVRCIVTPFDGTDEGNSVTTNLVVLKETPGTFPAAEIATIAGLLFASLFFAVLVLYILGKIGKKDEEEGEEPAPPEGEKQAQRKVKSPPSDQ